MSRSSCSILAALTLAACGTGADSATQAVAYDGPVMKMDWSDNATAYRGRNGTILAFSCDPNPDPELTFIWGTGIYSDDSPMCTSGVHAGAITFVDGGVVVIEIKPGQESYSGSTQNGVESSDWPSFEGSYSVLR